MSVIRLRLCLYCNSEFSPRKSSLAIGKGKFCSLSCASINTQKLRSKPDPKDIFFSNIVKNKDTGCWEYQATSTGGYGNLRVKGKKTRAHRYSFELQKGKIPPGILVCHSCDNPSCVNPDHLWLGSDLDNARDRSDKNRGNVQKGEASVLSKLTEKHILEIREKLSQGKTGISLSKEYGISKQHISKIKNRQKWKHI